MKKDIVEMLRRIKEQKLRAVYFPKGVRQADVSLTIFGDDEDYHNLLRSLQKEGSLFYSEKFCIANGLNKEVDKVDIELNDGRFYYLFNVNIMHNSQILFDLKRDPKERTMDKYFEDISDLPFGERFRI